MPFQTLQILDPFQTSVWLWRCFSYLMVVCTWYTIRRLSSKIFQSSCDNINVSTIAFFIFGLQVSQGVPKSELRNTLTNFIFIWLLISTFFLTSNYIANIKASYLASESSRRIESLEEAMADENMQIIIGKGTNLETLITNGSSSIYKEVATRLKAHPSNLIDVRYLESDCFDRVRDNDKMACIVIKSKMTKYIAQNPGHQLYMSKQSVTSGMTHMVMKKGFRYNDVFNKEIKALIETGKYETLTGNSFYMLLT